MLKGLNCPNKKFGCLWVLFQTLNIAQLKTSYDGDEIYHYTTAGRIIRRRVPVGFVESEI